MFGDFMERIQKAISWAVIASEFSHVFCCGIPITVSILSLLTEIGILSVMPTGFTVIHNLTHHWEIPMIIFSGILLTTGWALHAVSIKLDCHDTGCGHEPCGAKKKRSSKILIIASILFSFNVSIYSLVHRNFVPISTEAEQSHVEHLPAK